MEIDESVKSEILSYAREEVTSWLEVDRSGWMLTDGPLREYFHRLVPQANWEQPANKPAWRWEISWLSPEMANSPELLALGRTELRKNLIWGTYICVFPREELGVNNSNFMEIMNPIMATLRTEAQQRAYVAYGDACKTWRRAEYDDAGRKELPEKMKALVSALHALV